MQKNSENFSKTQIYLHWIIVALVALQYLLNKGIVLAWQERMEGKIANEPSLNLHVIVGAIILILMLWRLWLRFSHGVPALPESENKIATILAKIVHIGFYLLLIGLPLSGMSAWILGLQLPALFHVIGTNILLAIIVLHIGAALLHHFVLKTDVLKKIIGRDN